MRIISQDGTIDVTYENADLERKGTTISVWTLDNVYGSFARYSTEEKSIKAMEMCREQYAQSELNKDMIQKAADTLSKISVSVIDDVRKQLAEKYLFQFPADDEI